MDALLGILRSVSAALAVWSVASVVVAVPVAALFRGQARADRVWEQLERRRAWLETIR